MEVIYLGLKSNNQQVALSGLKIAFNWDTWYKIRVHDIQLEWYLTEN